MCITPKNTGNQIAIVMAYYGKLPAYFNFFLKSLSDKNFDVLFVSDLDVQDYPDNFRRVKIGFQELKALTEEKLGIPVALNTAYKLCDFKPMYGAIFEEALSSYAYWGWGDCDVVYGRKVNSLVGCALNSDFDVISFCKHWMSGCFSLVRNTADCRRLYEKANNWVYVCQTESNQVFDEIGGWWHRDVKEGRISLAECARRNDNYTAAVVRSGKRFFHEDLICEEKLGRGVVLMRDDGALFSGDREITLFHFLEIKNGIFKYGIRGQRVAKISSYRITRFGFFCTSISWRLRHFIMAYRWFLFELSIVRFYFAHARKVGIRRTILSFYRQSMNRIRKVAI